MQKLPSRGALSNPPGRFDLQKLEAVDDGWYLEDSPDSIATTLEPERARSVITTNDSPDIPFEKSINPYRGCETGCPYCAAKRKEFVDHKVRFTEINVTERPEAIPELLRLTKGERLVPVVVEGDGRKVRLVHRDRRGHERRALGHRYSPVPPSIRSEATAWMSRSRRIR